MTFKLEGDLITNLATMNEKVQEGVIAAANYTAMSAEAFMKSEAPWTDQTGAARNGLHAKVMTSGTKCAIVLYHTVPYGVFLEVRWGGKYGIIEKTMAAAGPLLVEALGRLVFDEVAS